mmetsp:Transcript_16260/g.39011  ORF Transcript_16260/g.39011 Transcript_16260/m.39011 type:complete len:133 (+) Transcript_16260:102-500(+)
MIRCQRIISSGGGRLELSWSMIPLEEWSGHSSMCGEEYPASDVRVLWSSGRCGWLYSQFSQFDELLDRARRHGDSADHEGTCCYHFSLLPLLLTRLELRKRFRPGCPKLGRDPQRSHRLAFEDGKRDLFCEK